jgi:hypothetical protein
MRMRGGIVLVVVVAAVAACTAPVPTPSASPTTNPSAAVATTPAPTGKGLWTAETGIHGTYFHFGNPPFGPPEYICGVGYNLSYAGGAPLVSVDVSALFPDAFAAHVTPSMVDRAIGWQHPASMQINSPEIHDAAWLSRLGGAIGATCQNGPTDLESLRGTILKVNWETIEGAYEQEVRVDEIRGEMTVFGMADGRTRVCWAEPRGC